MSTTSQLMTAEELLRLPRGQFRYELIEGELRQMSPAGYEHGKIAMRLGAALYQYVEEQQLGDVCTAETGFQLKSDPDTVRAPDVAFINRTRIAEVGDVRGYGHGAPDLAVEVVGPNDKVSEVEEKVAEWLAAGVKMVWVVSPKLHTLTVYRSRTDITTLTENDTLNGEQVVPGFQYPVARLFASKRS
jgi:Uma2 family endonuclease